MLSDVEEICWIVHCHVMQCCVLLEFTVLTKHVNTHKQLDIWQNMKNKVKTNQVCTLRASVLGVQSSFLDLDLKVLAQVDPLHFLSMDGSQDMGPAVPLHSTL